MDIETERPLHATTATSSTIELLQPQRRPQTPPNDDAYLDLLGEDDDPTGAHPGQRLMLSRALPLVYERLWRPVGARLLMGVGAPRPREEHRLAMRMLALRESDRVLDIACGPGNFTRSFAVAASAGLVVGLDASATMLRRAVADTDAANVAYVRGDACQLPFEDACFDAVCCFAALYLIDRPTRALDEIARVLAPGGRVALLSSCARGPLPSGLTDAVVRGLTGIRVFARDELTSALHARRLVDVEQRVVGLAQFVSARKPREEGG